MPLGQTAGPGPCAPGQARATAKYTHNALGQRVFKTEPLYSTAAPGTGKNLNNLLADDGEEEGQPQPGLIEQLKNFWSKLWSPSSSDAEKLGWSYVYAEDGSLLGEYGSGGNLSSGTAQYLYLPTASGPMPIAAIIKGQTYAIHSDHLNTPRKLTQADGQAAWQWAYSAFGEEQPTIGAKRFTSESTNPTTGATNIPEVTFNLRYPGQYFDSETKLHYNWNRTYDSRTGRYTQGDLIGLDGGWNRFAYVTGNPLSYTDPQGLNPWAGAWAGAGAGSAFGPVGTVVGGLIGAGAGAWIGWNIVGPMLIKPPDNAYDPNGPKAPGKLGEADGFKDPKGGDSWVPNPNPGKGGAGYGWQDANGDVWCPTGQGGTAHGGPHWDVQTPGGGYRNVRPQKK